MFIPSNGKFHQLFRASLTILTDTRTQRRQHKPHTTTENLCLKLQSFWHGLIDSCQDDVPTVISCERWRKLINKIRANLVSQACISLLRCFRTPLEAQQRCFSRRAILVAMVLQNSFVLVFMGYRTIIARYVAK